MKQRIAVIGGGLCGALLATLLRDRFSVTVIEQGRSPQPLFSDVDCRDGDVNTSINRAEGLGGTTNYWHNALIELAADDLRKAGVPGEALDSYYARAWELFLSVRELSDCARIRDRNREVLERAQCSVAHMVLPRHRANLWQLANARYPGADIQVVHGKAARVVPAIPGRQGYVEVQQGTSRHDVHADMFLVCAGGLSTPVILARSLGESNTFCPGYHDHPMAYVAKARLRPGSALKTVSCTTTETSEVRAGFVYEFGGIKAALYLRPAINLDLRSIQGPARFILSDLRNDPFSPRKLVSLVSNIEAVREALLFKSKSGFVGDHYSVLLLGEQNQEPARGLALSGDANPALNWHVTESERHAYQMSLSRFFEDFGDDVVESRQLPPSEWCFRTAAHHSGASAKYLSNSADGLDFGFFSVRDLPSTFVCDGSLLRASGIANSGLTLVALAYRLAELIAEGEPVPAGAALSRHARYSDI